jgi:hypothetical protein
MMLAYRLVRLVERHSDALAAGLLAKVQTSELTRAYCNVATSTRQPSFGWRFLRLGPIPQRSMSRSRSVSGID